MDAIFGDAASECDAFGDAVEGGEDVLANFFLVSADGELKMDVIGMMFTGAAVDRADSYDGGSNGEFSRLTIVWMAMMNSARGRWDLC